MYYLNQWEHRWRYKMKWLTTEKDFIALHYQPLIATHSAPEQWPSEKKTSTPKINPNESVLQLYIDI